jgi:two-component sensor histidine kinase
MGERLAVLLIEDSENDADLTLRELRKGGYDPVSARVETAEGMRKALAESAWNIIISDNSLPGFSGREALEILHGCGVDIPFILMSGAVGEETVVDILKAGAQDFIIKGRWARLVPAVQRELREADVRRAQREADVALRKSLAEKDILLKEIHHRVKNNLQVIISLLHLQEKNIPDPETRRMFSESQNRVHTMALIHERLYQSNDFEKIDFASYITSLARDLRDSYRVSEREVELRVDAEEIYLTIDRAITCGLIVNELLTNSFKYAFPNELRPEAPEVRIDLHRAHEGTVELVVSDNGVGLPAGMDPTQCESLGLSLVYMLANQLGGSAVYSRGARTRFTVSFKLD